MNAMIIQMHGEDGEEKMHIVMGKRLSGCDTSAAFPNWSGGWMPMVNVMMGGWSSPSDFNQTRNSMMGNFGTNPMGWLAFGLGWLGLAWLFMIFWWLLIIAGIVFLIRWLTRQIKGGVSLWGKSALDILKERYAKGEITKHEYEEMKKEILS
jgi:putative membrane protein